MVILSIVLFLLTPNAVCYLTLTGECCPFGDDSCDRYYDNATDNDIHSIDNSSTESDVSSNAEFTVPKSATVSNQPSSTVHVLIALCVILVISLVMIITLYMHHKKQLRSNVDNQPSAFIHDIDPRDDVLNNSNSSLKMFDVKDNDCIDEKQTGMLGNGANAQVI